MSPEDREARLANLRAEEKRLLRVAATYRKHPVAAQAYIGAAATVWREIKILGG